MRPSSGRVVVIGSGPVGASAARRLAERGCTVTLLEAGRAVPLRERHDAPSGEHLRNQPCFAREPEAYVIEAFANCSFYDMSQPREGLPGACETIAFGGQGILWTNNCPRIQSGLDRWPALDDAGWERRYGEAEALLRVSTDLFAASERQARVEARLRAHLSSSPGGRSIRRLPMAGWRDSAAAVRFVATADILAGLRERLDVWSDARALRIEHDGKRVVAVHVAREGREESLEADALVVAAGAFATPGLLHASDIRPPALGRWLHYHPLLLGQLVLDEDCSASSDDDPPPRLWIPPTRDMPWHGMVLRDIGAGTPREETPERRRIELQFFAPIEPRADNRMILGGGKPTFDVRLGERDEAVLEAMRADVEAIGAALGRWRKGCEPDWNPWGFSHPMGTTRMGDDPATTVVDFAGRVHGFENLHVAGPGVIPIAIAVNPTLTAVALALETADQVAASLT